MPKSPEAPRGFGPHSSYPSNFSGDGRRALPTLLELASQTLQLRRRGNSYWSPCPFHSEKTASFKIDERGGKQRFHCFGCGARGDVIDWLQRTENLSFHEALDRSGQKTTTANKKQKPRPTLTILTLPKEEQEKALLRMQFHMLHENFMRAMGFKDWRWPVI